MSNASIDPDDIRCLHAALVAKRTMLDQFLWQTPVLAFTAQAFLMTIAFSTSNSSFYRCLSGGIAAVIGLLSWQLFLRHTKIERDTTIELEALEIEFFGKTVHARPVASLAHVSRWRSRRVWAWCLFFVSLTGLMPLIELIFHLDL